MYTTKREDMEITLNNIDMGVIAITEANIRKKEKPKDLEIEGYKLITDRARDTPADISRTALLVRNDLNYMITYVLMKMNKMPETWVDIVDKNGKKILICCMYRVQITGIK